MILKKSVYCLQIQSLLFFLFNLSLQKKYFPVAENVQVSQYLCAHVSGHGILLQRGLAEINSLPVLYHRVMSHPRRQEAWAVAIACPSAFFIWMCSTFQI